MERRFQSTLPVRGATPQPCGRTGEGEQISIHAPREGSDLVRAFPLQLDFGFQSTLPVRGATRRTESEGCRYPYFNPRSP